MKSNNINIVKLEARVKAAQGVTNAVLSDTSMRNIAFCSAGNLSKGSKSKLNSWRNKSAIAIEKSIAGEVALAVAKGAPQKSDDIVSKFITLSSPVEMAEHQALIHQNQENISASTLEKVLRIIIAKFDKRLARSLPVTLLIGSKKVILSPSSKERKGIDLFNDFAAIFGHQTSDEFKQRFFSYVNGPTQDEWNCIRSYSIVGGKTLWQAWCAVDQKAARSGGEGFPDSETLRAAIREQVEAKSERNVEVTE